MCCGDDVEPGFRSAPGPFVHLHAGFLVFSPLHCSITIKGKKKKINK